WKAKEVGLHTHFIELAGEINRRMPEYVVDKLASELNARRKSVNGAKILILGVAYKRDIDDMRESPALEIIEMLLSRGAEVSYHDPHIAALPKTRRHDIQLQSQELRPELLASLDAAVLITDHSGVDYDKVLESTPLVIDTRGKFRGRGITVVPA
ncbi:hypothetical protein EON82_26590, partial [bacterium]